MLQHRSAKSSKNEIFEKILVLRIPQNKVGNDFLKEAFNQSLLD